MMGEIAAAVNHVWGRGSGTGDICSRSAPVTNTLCVRTTTP